MKNLLVFHIGHLGDTVMMLPSLWALRRAFPDASFTLLTDHMAESGFVHASELFKNTDFFQEWLSFKKNLSGKWRQFFSMTMLLPELRRRRFDALVYLTPSLREPRQVQRDKLFFKTVGLRQFFGFQGFEHARMPSGPLHESLRILQRLKRDGIDVSTVSFDMQLGKEDKARLEIWMNANGADLANKNCIAVAPFTKMQAKRWPLERYEKLIAYVIEKFRAFPIIIGGAEERPDGEALTKSWATGLNAAGLPIRETAALLKHCRGFIGADSGNMHLAAAVGVPCLAIFSARDEIGKWHPFGQGHIVLRKDIHCAGCRRTLCDHQSCLMQITVQEAVAAVDHLFAGLGPCAY